jgi:hypothetical protein
MNKLERQVGTGSGEQVIAHDPPPPFPFLYLLDDPGFLNIQISENDERGNGVSPGAGKKEERQVDSGNFVDDDPAGVFRAASLLCRFR